MSSDQNFVYLCHLLFRGIKLPGLFIGILKRYYMRIAMNQSAEWNVKRALNVAHTRPNMLALICVNCSLFIHEVLKITISI